MKRWFAALFCALLVMGMVPAAGAADTDTGEADGTEVEYFSDGSYMVSVVEDVESGISTASNMLIKAKTSTYYSANDVAQWYVRVVGTFTYDYDTSKCIASGVSTHVYVDTWKISNTTQSVSGNTAIASATAKYYVLGAVQYTISKTVTLTCSASGRLS